MSVISYSPRPDGIRRERLLGLLLNTNDAPLLKDWHAEALGIGHFLQHHHGALFELFKRCSRLANVALNDVVAQNHADFVALGPGLGQAQRIGDSSFSFLIGKAELLQTEFLTVL